ncbi:MAG: phosphatidylserine decarboxylase, partial [Candidatus Dadabacteria bacterium]
MERKRPPIATEGFTYLGILAFLAWAAAITGFITVSFVFAGAAVVVLFFFRDPERDVPDAPEAVVSPADGEVLEVAEIYERDFLGMPATRISISLAVYDCHIIRMPVKGRVTGTKYSPGSFLIANMPRWLVSEGMTR